MQRERELGILPELDKPNKGEKEQTKSLKAKETREEKRFFKKRDKKADSPTASLKAGKREGKEADKKSVSKKVKEQEVSEPSNTQ